MFWSLFFASSRFASSRRALRWVPGREARLVAFGPPFLLMGYALMGASASPLWAQQANPRPQGQGQPQGQRPQGQGQAGAVTPAAALARVRAEAHEAQDEDTAGKMYLKKEYDSLSILVEERDISADELEEIMQGRPYMKSLETKKHSVFVLRNEMKEEVWFRLEGKYYEELPYDDISVRVLDVAWHPPDEIYIVYRFLNWIRVAHLGEKQKGNEDLFGESPNFNRKVVSTIFEMEDNELTLTLLLSDGTTRRYSRNPAGQWTRIETDVNRQTQNSALPTRDEDDLFVPSTDASYWEYLKGRPGVPLEGDGLFVFRRAIPPAATKEEHEAELQNQGRALAYEYRFQVHHITPEVEMFSRTMWMHRVENPARTAVDFEVYDVTFDREADVMVVLFRQNGVLRANLLRGPNNGLAWANTQLDLSREQISGVTRASIEGGPDEKSLRLVLRGKDSTQTFALDNETWARLP